MKETSGVVAWLLGRTPRQREALRRNVAHPMRTALTMAIPYGVVMSFLMVRDIGPFGLLTGAVAGVVFGWLWVLCLRRWERRLEKRERS